MYNPLLNPVTELSDEELSDNIRTITQKYYMTSNSLIKDSLSHILNVCVEEQSSRLMQMNENTEDFSKYINVN